MVRLPNLHGILVASVTGLLLVGCDAQDPSAPTVGLIRPASVGGVPTAERNFVYLCKDGTDATFDYSVGGTPSTISIVNGDCQLIANYAGGFRQAVNVTELIPANTVLDSLTLSEIYGRTDDPVGTTTNTTFTGTASVSTWVGLEWGAVITYYNRFVPPPPPGGGEGCTPGYWKQSQHFDSWTAPYTPTTLFSDVFENAFPGKTLLAVASNGGGGLNALGRHTVAALLNGASGGVDYDQSAQAVIDAFNAVFPGGDYEGQKNIFAAFNEQGCPLN